MAAYVRDYVEMKRWPWRYYGDVTMVAASVIYAQRCSGNHAFQKEVDMLVVAYDEYLNRLVLRSGFYFFYFLKFAL